MKAMGLEVVNEKGKRKLMLDGKILHHVMGYKIESLHKGDYAELSIKMLVRYPLNQENKI